MRHLAFLLLSSLNLLGCNQYALFRLAGDTYRYSDKADILIVVDNSQSMAEESAAMVANFQAFADILAQTQAKGPTNGLHDATDDFIAAHSRSKIIDFQIGITTTDILRDRGALLGAIPIVGRDDADLIEQVQQNLLCEANCYEDGLLLPSDDPTYTCDQPFNGLVSSQYLDCLCGEEVWRDNCGTDDEEGLEAAYTALCRSVPDPPAECSRYGNIFSGSDVLGNDGFLREGSTFLPIILTDEGDDSRRIVEPESTGEIYNQLADEFGDLVTVWSAITPPLNAKHELICPEFGSSWGVLRHQFLAEATGGRLIDLFDENCQISDFSKVFSEIAYLLGGLTNAFPLQTDPLVETIVVIVNGKTIPPEEQIVVDALGIPIYGNGWTYDSRTNAVLLHGNALPEADAQVRIYYQPR